MKIAIPKTLLEPGTIRWPTPYGHGQSPEYIIAVLTEEFRELDDAQLLPTAEKGMTIAMTCDHIRWLAERRGMNDISTTSMNIRLDATVIGYLFIVRFSEPGKSKHHYVQLKTYF